MGWVETLHGKTVGVDTSPFIFFMEEHDKYAPVVEPFFESVSRGEITLVTSTVTLLEVLVHSLRHDDEPLAQRYNDILLSSPHISTIAVTPRTAQVAAELRAEHNLKMITEAESLDEAFINARDATEALDRPNRRQAHRQNQSPI